MAVLYYECECGVFGEGLSVLVWLGGGAGGGGEAREGGGDADEEGGGGGRVSGSVATCGGGEGVLGYCAVSDGDG